MMAIHEMDFEILKDEAGEVIGFSLWSQGEGGAEDFCRDFPGPFRRGKGVIRFEGGEIVLEFADPLTYSLKGRFAHKISARDSSALQEILGKTPKQKRRKRGKLNIERFHAFSPGFKITT